jgi:class I fructose-bisphosphate aldolase
VECAFDGRRILIFSGGAAEPDDVLLEQIHAIRDGGGFGSIIGRNSFQRKKPEALQLLDNVIKIYLGK